MENEKLAEVLAGLSDSMTEEQKEKAAACKTVEEMMALAAREGIELPDEVLDAVAGGGRMHIRGEQPPKGEEPTPSKC